MIASTLARCAALVAALGVWAGVPGTGQGAEGCGASYTVRSGDTLAAIAERCATSVEALMQANPVITDPARISIGWDLAIPGAHASLGPESEVQPRSRSGSAEAALAAGSYEVQAGDSFASIATALQVPMRALTAANKGVDPFALKPGQVLQLPAESEMPAPSTADARLEPEEEPATDAAADQPMPADTAQEEPGVAKDGSEPAGAVERVMLEGRVERGTECPVLQTPEGKTYSLVSSQYGFAPGEYVEIEGETVDLSFCSAGWTTVRVTSMAPAIAPAQAPRGG